ncbi:MAG: hypothetical protein HYY84_02015 [Deltaproteobacteria bacterium]|nr:hypothetical protein [Deltaproteobacteria bacterium]
MVSPAAHASLSTDAMVDVGRRLLREWRVGEARELGESLVAQNPKDASVLALAGEARFYAGDYAGALELLGRISEGDVDREVRELKALARSTADVVKGFKEVSNPGGHFTIRVQAGKDEALLPYAFEALEMTYREVTADLGHTPRGRILVEVYDAPAKLARVSALTVRDIETSGTIALCKWNRLMITSPRALLRGYAWLDTLAHEFVHLVVTQASGNTVPIWLHEGIAKFEENRWREPRAPRGSIALGAASRHLLANALKKKSLITFEQMHPSMAKLPSQEAAALAFAEVHAAVAYIVERAGQTGLSKLLAELKGGKPVERAVGDALQSSFARFKSDWVAWLGKLGLKPDPALAHGRGFERLRFKRGRSGADDAKDSLDLETIPRSQKEARRFARLANILHARGRTKPAIVEYEKALERAKAPLTAIAAPLAQAYLEVGNCVGALRVLRPVATRLTNPNHLARFGDALGCQGNASRAIAAYVGSIRINPFAPDVHKKLRKLYIQTGDLLRATTEATVLAALGVHEPPEPPTSASSLPTQPERPVSPKADAGSRAMGFLSVDTTPVAQVYLDGVRIGVTPIREWPVVAGVHQLRLVAVSAATERTLRVAVAKDARVSVSEKLER